MNLDVDRAGQRRERGVRRVDHLRGGDARMQILGVSFVIARLRSFERGLQLRETLRGNVVRTLAAGEAR